MLRDMNGDEIAEAKALEVRIDRLAQQRDTLADTVHRRETRKDAVLAFAAIIGCGFGIVGLIATLIEGINILYAAAMLIGGVTFWLCRDAEKRSAWQRQRLDQVLREIEECEQRYQSVTAPRRLKAVLESR